MSLENVWKIFFIIVLTEDDSFVKNRVFRTSITLGKHAFVHRRQSDASPF